MLLIRDVYRIVSVLRIRDVYRIINIVYPPISDPDFYPSRIQDLESSNNNKRGGKIYLLPHLVATKPKIILFLNRYRKFF